MKNIRTTLLCMILICAFSFLASCKNEEQPPHEHSWGEWVEVVKPTCDAEGIKECFCTECKEGKKETIEKLEHEYINEEVLAPATCSSNGVKVYNCKHCGILKEEEITKLDHKIENGSCTVCGTSVMEIAKYTITVEFNEGIGNDPSGEYASGDKVYLSNPTKEGYTFMGWYTTPDFKENTKVDNCVVVEENLNLYAKWDFIGIVITLDANGGYLENSEIVTYPGETLAIETPKPMNCKFFAGWYLGEQPITDDRGVLLKDADISEDVTLVAKWEDELVVNGVKYMYSGSYPQSVVTNKDIIAELNKLTAVNELGYLEYNGLQYEKLTYTQGTYQTWFNDETPVEDGATYYFLVEPVLWRVLDKDNCVAITDKIIDTRYYAKSDKVNNIKPTVSANNYEYSDVNNWLNADGDYYDTNFAFKVCESADEVVKNIIFTVGLENGLISTKDESNPYVCDNITAYFYLLSCAEYVDSYKEILGLTKATDYAICKGVLVDYYSFNAEWWLRTPSADGAGLAKYVTCTGDVATTKVNNANIGIRPLAAFKSLAVLGGEDNE